MTDYSVAQVEAITGIKAHTLRIWERRYSFLKPKRTDTNIRYYTDNELKLLVSIALLIRNGHKVSKIDTLSHEEIESEVGKLLKSNTSNDSDEITGLTLSMINLDETRFSNIFQRLLIRKGLLNTITDVIYPFLSNAGFLWGSNQISPIHEHFVSNLIRQKIISATDMLPVNGENSRAIVMFLPSGEQHEIGLLLANFIARNFGWNVYYLGQDVPVEHLTVFNNYPKVELLLTMVITPLSESIIKSLNNLFTQLDIPILISGNVDNLEGLNGTSMVKIISSPGELMEILESDEEISNFKE